MCLVKNKGPSIYDVHMEGVSGSGGRVRGRPLHVNYFIEQNKHKNRTTTKQYKKLT